MSAVRAYRRSMTEAELQAGLVEAAERAGCLVAHVRDSRAQQVPGLPDLIIACPRLGRVYFLELKRQDGTRRPMQKVWAAALADCQEAVYALVKPERSSDAISYDDALAWIREVK